MGSTQGGAVAGLGALPRILPARSPNQVRANRLHKSSAAHEGDAPWPCDHHYPHRYSGRELQARRFRKAAQVHGTSSPSTPYPSSPSTLHPMSSAEERIQLLGSSPGEPATPLSPHQRKEAAHRSSPRITPSELSSVLCPRVHRAGGPRGTRSSWADAQGTPSSDRSSRPHLSQPTPICLSPAFPGLPAFSHSCATKQQPTGKGLQPTAPSLSFVVFQRKGIVWGKWSKRASFHKEGVAHDEPGRIDGISENMLPFTLP